MTWDNIPRTHSFSLSDFHDFDRCVFRFFVHHHLGQKYELAEGNTGQAVGSLLDLAIKKIHTAKIYNQPVDYLYNLIRAAEVQIKEEVRQKGLNSFYGSQVQFLTEDTVNKAKEVFGNYHRGIGGKFKVMVTTRTLKTPKPFWKMLIKGNSSADSTMQLWGGPDSIEMGEDGVPEVVDYKYFQKGDESTNYLDMDLMPKVYTLLCARELLELGYTKAKFKVRLWHDPKNESFYEEFELGRMVNIEDYLKDKIERILRTDQLSFCNKSYCKACNHIQKEEWIKELVDSGWIKR